MVARAAVAGAIAAMALTVQGREAAGQWLPQEPVSLAGGRVTIGAEALVTVGSDDEGYFNYTDYERSVLELVRFDLVTGFKLTDRIGAVVDLRAEGDTTGGAWSGGLYSAYARLRPWRRAVEFHAGRIAPVFGTLGQAGYTAANPLIGYPLAWQYLTSLRPDSVPRSADELLANRGRGWLVRYSVGASYPEAGVPVGSAFRYDDGLSAHLGADAAAVSASVGVTAGTLSVPRPAGDNGPALAGRVRWRPTAGLLVATSLAAGGFVSGEIDPALPSSAQDRRYRQTAAGADAEYSRGRWLVRGEAIWASWKLPAVEAPRLVAPLEVRSLRAEGRYTILPGLYVAARYDRLDFAWLRGSASADTWDADVERLEAGGGYRLARNVTLRASVQHNTRSGSRVRERTLGAVQLGVWF